MFNSTDSLHADLNLQLEKK